MLDFKRACQLRHMEKWNNVSRKWLLFVSSDFLKSEDGTVRRKPVPYPVT